MKDDKFTIPSDNFKLEEDLKLNKDKYMKHIYDTFVKNINSKTEVPGKIELFSFKETNLQVIVKKDHFVTTLQNLQDYYISKEEYEVCNIIKRIINIVDL